MPEITETITLGGRLPIPPATKVAPAGRPAPKEPDDDPPDAEAPAEDFDTPDFDEQSLDIKRDFTPIDPPTEAERNHRRAQIDKIKSYRNIFPDQLVDLDLTSLGSRSDYELDTLVQDCSWLVGCRNSVQASRGLFIAACTVVESGAPFVGMNLTGLPSVCASSKDLLQAIDEVSIARGATPTTPEARLLLAFGGILLQLDAHNKKLATNAAPEQPCCPSATGSLPEPTKPPRASAEGL